MKDNNVFELTPRGLIASGAYCECYEHPFDLEECIKIPFLDHKAKKRLKMDLVYYRTLYKQQKDLKYIADYLGTCETSLGEGYRYECIRDADMKVSQTLDYYLNLSDDSLKHLYLGLHKLARYLVENRILISDIHTKNILIRLDSEGVMNPVIVDGIGDRVAITIFNLSSKLVESKIIRRWNRFSRKQLNGHALFSEK